MRRTGNDCPPERGSLAAAFVLPLGLALVVGCRSEPGMPSAKELAAMVNEAEEPALDHTGPRVDLGDGGPSRFVRLLYNGFRVERAMELVEFMDARYRTPGSEGFRESSERIEAALREVGFGERPDLELDVFTTQMEDPAWNARSGELRLFTGAGGEALLHAFDDPADQDRCLLPENAPSCDVEGPVRFELDEVTNGDVLVTEAALRNDLLVRAKRKGAAAVLSASMSSYNVDPSGRDQHLDAMQFRTVPAGTDLPVAQISPRSLAQIQEAHAAGGARVRLRAEVELGDREVRTVAATIVGTSRPEEVVVLSTHLEAPGACDNASGAAGQLENATTLVRVLDGGGLERPARSVTFLWGLENDQVDLWLERTERTAVAAVNAVMIGESRDGTGAVPLLERYPDPGAVVTIPPDKHSLWGSRDIEPEWLVPNGLSIVARCALVDVGRHVGTWETFENPYEGGTDHERFLHAQVPAVLFWHFTDFTFHTSLDRLGRVDGEELRRMATAAMATALAIADPLPSDLTRYLRSLDQERNLRVTVAEEAGRLDVAEDWRSWTSGARQWFRVLCLPIEGEEAWLPTPLESASLKTERGE